MRLPGARGPFSGQGPVQGQDVCGWMDPQPLPHQGSHTQPWTNGGPSVSQSQLIRKAVFGGEQTIYDNRALKLETSVPAAAQRPPTQPSLAPGRGPPGPGWGLKNLLGGLAERSPQPGRSPQVPSLSRWPSGCPHPKAPTP